MARKPRNCYGKLNQSSEPGTPARPGVPSWTPPGSSTSEFGRRAANAEASSPLVSLLKTWKVDFLQAPSRKLLPALAAPLTEHVQAALRMLRRAPVRFLLRDPRRLLAQPELSVAGRSPFSSRDLVVVPEAPRPSFPLHPLGSAALFRKQPS